LKNPFTYFTGAGVALALLFCIMGATEDSCDPQPSSDLIQRIQQETILQEGTRETGMPNIHNFRERKLLKMILELRDEANLTTYTYLFNTMAGKVGEKLCDSIGYPIPYATEYTNPQKPISPWQGTVTIPQADPNGLFSPTSAEGTWVLCKDPNSPDVKPVYVEPRVVCSPFALK